VAAYAPARHERGGRPTGTNAAADRPARTRRPTARSLAGDVPVCALVVVAVVFALGRVREVQFLDGLLEAAVGDEPTASLTGSTSTSRPRSSVAHAYRTIPR